MRYLLSTVVALTLFSSSADASVIWLYKEVETVTSTASLTVGGTTYVNSQQASGAVLLNPLVTELATGADLRGIDIPPGNTEISAVGSGAVVRQTAGGLEFSASTGYGECNDWACSAGTALGSMDLIFDRGRTPRSRRATTRPGER